MSLNQTVRGLIDRLPTLTSEERWVVTAILDIADQRSSLAALEPMSYRERVFHAAQVPRERLQPCGNRKRLPCGRTASMRAG